MMEKEKFQGVRIYTDGAALGNPGPGGYGIVMEWRNTAKELSGGFRLTTNNRMELLAVIVALESLKRRDLSIEVVSDSKYVIDAVKKGWLNGWVKKGLEKRPNADLWRRLLQVKDGLMLEWTWVKGHAGHPQNERCDELATACAGARPTAIDTPYESTAKLKNT